MGLKIRFMGTGTSVGVPQIGCDCATCTSSDPRDRRRRTGAYVFTEKSALAVDTPPEFREACIEYGITKVDAVAITHAHMDHIAGFDDVRRFNTLNGEKAMRCYGSPETVAAMKRIFPYIGNRPNRQGLFRPMIDFTEVEGEFRVGDIRVTPLEALHGDVATNGYLFESGGARIGYVSDCRELPRGTVEALRGVDAMVLDCLRPREHPTHMNVEAAMRAMEEIAPRRGYFIHMSHSLKHAEFKAGLPGWLSPAYDGLVVEC